jgi:hypothetical protein
MAQLASASDFVQLPVDSTGKKSAFALRTVGGGGQLYLPVALLVDEAGNPMDNGVADLAMGSRGLGVRKIPRWSYAVGDVTWDNTTAANTVLSVDTTGYASAAIWIGPSTTLTTGSVCFDGAVDTAGNRFNRIYAYEMGAGVGNPANLQNMRRQWLNLASVANTRHYRANVAALTRFRVRLIDTLTSPQTLRVIISLSELPWTPSLTEDDALRYSGGITNLAVVTGATDVFTIYPTNANPNIRVRKIEMSGTANTAVLVPIRIIKRSSTNTGGTSTNPNATALDSVQNIVSQAQLAAYTANPSSLGSGNVIRASQIILPLSSGPLDRYVCDFGGRGVVLHGTGEGVAVNLNGTAITTGLLNIYCEWEEE